MEHLEKIPYLLSIFAPIAAFFIFGLVIAWFVWYRHANRLEVAYGESLKLTDQIEKAKREERDLSARAIALINGAETKWSSIVSKKDRELEGINKRYGKLKTEADGFRNDLSAKDGELAKLTGKLSNVGKENESRISGLMGKVSGFEGDLSKRDAELKKLNASLADRDKELSGLRADLKARNGEIDKLKADLDGRGAELQTLKSSASGNSEQLQKLKVDLGNRDVDLKKLNLSLADRDKELNGLRGDLKTRTGEIDKLKADFGNRDAELKKLQASISTKDKELEGLRNDLKARSGEIGKLKTDFDGRGSEIQTLKSSLTGSEQQAQKWRTDFANREAELKKHRADLEQRGKQITTLEASLKTKTSDLDKLRAELQAKQAAAAKLEAQITEADKKTAGLRNDLSGKEGELKKLQAEQANLQKTLDKYKQDSTRQIQGLSSDVTKRNGTIADLEARLKAAKNAITDHEKKIKDAQKALSAQEAENKKSAAQLQKVEGNLDKSNNEVERLKAGLKDRDGNLRTLKSDLGAKEKEALKLDKDAQRFQSDAEKWRLKAQDTAALDRSKNRVKELEAALAAEKDSAKRKASGLSLFDGESVSEDKSLGFLYKSKPDKTDDLTRVKGVGDVIVKKLHNFGVYRFKQIALWRQDQIDAFSKKLAFKGRIEREIWVNQAADLHFADYKERLRPVVNIYHPPISRVSKGNDPAAVDAAFEGEAVSRDNKLGLVYKKRPSQVDDLKQISGVAGVLEKKLHKFGIYRFKQVALWQQEQIDEFSKRLNFSDRVYREMWVHQAVDFHFVKYDEHLTPQVEIYRKPKRTPVVKEKAAPAPNNGFAGEPVKNDEKLGLVFTKRPAKVDDLKRIKGIAHVLEDKLHKFGVYRFKQIAMWKKEHIAELSERLSFRDRVERDKWKEQAALFDNETNN